MTSLFEMPSVRARASAFLFFCSAVLLSHVMSPATAYANAHCFCKLGPPSSPIHDFGEIATYNTQIGHDSACSALCISRADSYMSSAANKTAACNASHGASIVTYSAVGTKSYQPGKTYACPINSAPQPSIFLFGTTPAVARSIDVNGVGVNLVGGSPVISVPISTPFTTFTLNDYLSSHVQSWTYDATLYRDNVRVDHLSGKSPAFFRGSVLAQFTGQPNAYVHGHNWKIEWHYFGPNFSNGNVTFHIQ